MKNYYKWLALLLLTVSYFFELGTRNVYSATLPNIQNTFGVTSAQIGLVGTVFTIVYGVLAPFTGILSDIFSRKWTITCGVAVFCIGIFLAGFSGGILTLTLTYGVLVAIGSPFFYPAAGSLLTQLHKDSKATALSILQVGLYVGIVVCSCVSGYFADMGGEGWRKAFWVVGAVGIAWVVVIALLLKDTPHEKTAEEVDAASEKPTIMECVKALVSKPSAIMYLAYFALMVFVFIGYSTWTPTLLKDKFPALSMAAAATHAVLWHHCGAVVGIMLGSRLGDRWVKSRPSIRLEMTIFGVAGSIPMLVLMVYTQSLLVMNVALLVYGIFRGFFDSNLYVGLVEVIKPRFRSSALGLSLGAAYVFGALAPWGLGVIRECFSIQAGYLLFAILYAMVIVLIFITRKFFFKKDYVG